MSKLLVGLVVSTLSVSLFLGVVIPTIHAGLTQINQALSMAVRR